MRDPGVAVKLSLNSDVVVSINDIDAAAERSSDST